MDGAIGDLGAMRHDTTLLFVKAKGIRASPHTRAVGRSGRSQALLPFGLSWLPRLAGGIFSRRGG
jgi:hypothetical protein